MSTRDDYFTLLGQAAKIRSEMATRFANQRPGDSFAEEIVTNQLGDLEHQLEGLLGESGRLPADKGLSALVGLGDEASPDFGGVPAPIDVPSYDEAVISERLFAVADLYYCYQLERLGMFRAIRKLQELFRAGKLRLGSGPGAFELYRFDRRDVLRYTTQQRLQAYRRVLGYTDASPPAGARPNSGFHSLFTQFNLRVAQLFRDKRIADTFRPGAGAADPGFGSIAMARRAGLDVRSNLKRASYGDVNVLTVELLQLISSAFEILSAPDIRHQFGTDTGWDTLEEVLERYLGEVPVVSQRSRMGETGRAIINWLAQNYILTQGRTAFETLIQGIAEMCEEWLTSAEALGIAKDETTASSANIVEFPGARRSAI
jgi:hypothetical protein